MFNIGTPELILILVVALIVLGPKRLPELAKSLGRGLREFQKAAEDLKDSLQKDFRPDAESPAESEEAERPIAITPPPNVSEVSTPPPSTGQSGPEHGR